MRRVLIYQKDAMKDIVFEKEYLFDSILIQESKKGVVVCRQNLMDYQTCSIKDITFVCMPYPGVYSFVVLKEEMFIGRDSSLDICIPMEWISNVHARIFLKDHSFYVEDLDSTNGLYYNSFRISSLQLENNRVFYLANVKCIFFDSFLLLSYPFISDPIPDLSSLESYDMNECLQPPVFSFPIAMELESFVIDRDPVKQKIFQSIGSSVLILCSSFISCILMYVMYPEQPHQLISMVLMSGSMAISFMFFGLYNRKVNYQNALDGIETNKKLYLSYLDDLDKKITSIQQSNQKQIEEIQQNALCLNYKDDIVLSIESVEGISFLYRKWNYQHANHAMVSLIQEWIEKHTISLQQPLFLKKDSYYVEANLEWAYGLFEAICESHLPVKVVWISSNVNERILCNKRCIIDHKRLWIKDLKSYERILPLLSLYPTLYFINDLSFPLLDGYKIYLQTNGIKVLPYKFNLSRYRNVLFTSSQKSSLSLETIYKKMNWKDQVNLRVCAGLDKSKQPLWIDFQEGKDGPHGLVAGSTGYGKSEWLSNILLQLVWNNHPKYLQYILIDFKGGAFGSVFTSFPHYAGMITNLDHDIHRFLSYISSFVHQRQTILKEFQNQNPSYIAHVDAYNAIHTKNPLSHVFLIVDEFAQMKTEAIELLSHIKQLARIGRSLGIHLILSTQKPLGVIDDQIWANSNFHVCLKVLSPQDSKEVIHSEDAYYLQFPGEFIFQNQSGSTYGKGFYVHDQKERTKKPIEVNGEDEFIQDVSRISYLDFVSNEINDLKMKPNLIIPCSLLEYKMGQEWCIYEDLKKRKFQAFNCEYGQVVSILTNDVVYISRSIVATTIGPVYTLNIQEMDDYVDGCFFDDSLYWKLIHLDRKTTLILSIESFGLWASLFNKANYRIFIILKTIKNAYTSYFDMYPKMCIRYSNIDMIRNYFQNFTLSSCVDIGILKIENEFHSFCLNPKKSQVKEHKELLIEKEMGFAIGLDEKFQTIYWNGKNPLIICFVQKSMKKRIHSLLNEWKKKKDLRIKESLDEFDICICDVSIHQDLLSSMKYIQNHYDWDVLWMGKGSMDYSYLLHKKIPLVQGDMVYWHEDREVILKWKEF